MLVDGQGVPLSVFKLEDAHGEDDDKEYAGDTVGTDGRFREECDCDGVYEPRLEHLEPRLQVPWSCHAVVVEFNFSLVPRAK